MTDPKEGDANWNPVTAGDSTQQQDSTVSNVVGPIPATEPKVIVLHRSALLVQWDRWIPCNCPNVVQWDRWIACNCPNDETRDWWNSHEGQHFSVVPLEALDAANARVRLLEEALTECHSMLSLLRHRHFDRSGKGAFTPPPDMEIDHILGRAFDLLYRKALEGGK